jgi:gliding motility-associated-like protein
MKYVILFIILFCPAFILAQWYPVTVPTTQGLEAIAFTDTLHGYIPLWDGTMLQSSDGGTNWQVVPTGASSLIDVWFPTTSTGYSAGGNGSIVKTTNAGVTWSVVNSPTTNVLRGVFFLNPDTGFICGQGERIYRTTNGGISWVQQNSGAYWLRQFSFPTPQLGYCAGDNHLIFKTTDGGITWNQLPGSGGTNLNDIQFLTVDTGYVCGINGYAAKSFDGGQTWQVLNTGTTAEFMGLWFFNSQVGYCVGLSGLILKTLDGGITWNQESSNTSVLLLQLFFINQNKGFICGAAGTLLTNGNCLPPTGSITGPSPVCQGDTGKIYSVNTVTHATSYHWNVPPGVIITSGLNTNIITTSFTINSVSGSFSVYAFNNNCNSIPSPSFPVIVNAFSVPTIVGPAELCLDTLSWIYTTQAGMTNYIWSVSSGGTIISGGTGSNNSVTVRWNSSGTQTVSVNYSSPNGCTAPSPTVYNVTVNPLPIPTITGPTPVCVGSSGNVYSTQRGMTNYLWFVSPSGTITSGGGISDSTVTVTWNNVGVQTVSVNYTNSNGCSATDPFAYDLIVNPLPFPSLSGPTPVCVNSTGNVYTTQPGMTGYAWSVAPGGTITAGGSALDSSITITWISMGIQSVSVNYASNDGCSDTATVVYNVTVNPPTVPTIAGSKRVCVNSTSNVYTTEAGMTGYNWSVSLGGTVTAGGGPGDNSVTVTWTDVGAQTVGVIYTNTYGCTLPEPVVFNVIVIALPIPALIGPTPVCVGSINNHYSTQALMSNYSWNISTGGLITSGFGTNQVTVNWNNPGNQFISINFITPEGCTALSPNNFPVTVNPFPGQPGIISGPQKHCTGAAEETYSVDTIAFATTYNWQLPPGFLILTGIGTNTITVAIDSSVKTGDIYVYGTNPCGDGLLSQPFHFISQKSPIVDAGPDMSIPYDSTVQLNGSISGGSGSYSYSWIPSNLLSVDTILKPGTVRLTHDALFFITATDLLNWCQNTDSVRVKVYYHEISEDCLVFHNVITPNGDGLNDKWIIDCIDNFPDNKVIIFNIWGNRVNSFDNYDNESQVWKGTTATGKPLPDGTYYYIFTIKNGNTHTGWIFLRGI